MTLQRQALEYAQWGWPVLPCHWIENGLCSCGDPGCRSQGKHPLAQLVPKGLHQATTEELIVEEWWKRYPFANIAIRTGNGLCVVDIDNKAGVNGEVSMRDWESQFGTLPPTLTAATGGGGLHLYFSYDASIKIQSGTNRLGTGVDIRADGGYVLAPASNHKSGKTYQWSPGLDPLKVGPIPMPPALLEALRSGTTRQQELREVAPVERPLIPLTEGQAEEIWSALQAIPVGNRESRIRIGMALHSTSAGTQAFELWGKWLALAENYNPTICRREMQRSWHSFNSDRLDAITLNSLFHEAMGYGWTSAPTLAPPVAPTVVLEATNAPNEGFTETAGVPHHLLTLPGPLGAFAGWMNRSAPVRQPQFSVQAALALGAVACGRLYTTDRDNWSALYLLNIGPSGCGKEYARGGLLRVLLEAEMPNLISSGGYTSDGAVFSALLSSPAHLAVIDEMGMMMEGAKSKGNHVGASAIKSMMELWGSCNSAALPKGYSTMTLTQEQREKMKVQPVHNPCLSLLGLTTPGQFYEQLSKKEVHNGFLNRFIIVETAYGLGEEQDSPRLPLPSETVEWLKTARRPLGNLNSESNPHQAVRARLVPFSENALKVKRDYSADIRTRRTAMTANDELLSRCVEQAMRIALILAVNDDPLHPLIHSYHMEWARDYIDYYTSQLLNHIELRIANSQHEEKINIVLAAIKKAGKKGLSTTELAKQTRSLPTKQRRELLADLVETGAITSFQEKTATNPITKWRVV